MAFKISHHQHRALSKLSRAWQSAGQINERTATLNTLVEVGLAEREPKHNGKYRLTPLPKIRKTKSQKKDLAKQAEWKPDYKIEPRWIVSAAMQKNNRIITGPRHFDKTMRQQMEASEGIKWWQGCKQGFIDQFGDFLTREHAWVIAKKNKQIRRKVSAPNYLFSENLY